MTLTVQNLRATSPGVEPASLLPGQIAFNIPDKTFFIGDGSNFKTSFTGTQTPGENGGGWFSLPLSYAGFGEYYLLNPEEYGPPPSNGQILAYSSTSGKPQWVDGSSIGGAAVYVTNNNAVQVAPGVTTSDKISSALGITPVEADSAIVVGVPGDTFQGLYLFTGGNWVYAAGYADPLAIDVPYNNTVSGLVAATVQAAIDELADSKLDVASNAPFSGGILSWNGTAPVWVTLASIYPTASDISYNPSGTGLPPFADTVQEALTLTWGLADNAFTDAQSAQSDATSAQNTANLAIANSNAALENSSNAVNTANSAYTVAAAALPKTGGTMTGNIFFNNGQPVDAGSY